MTEWRVFINTDEPFDVQGELAHEAAKTASKIWADKNKMKVSDIHFLIVRQIHKQG